MFDSLHVPHFARLHEYAGLWAIEPNAFATYWRATQTMDLAAHIRAAAPATPSSGLETVSAKSGGTVAIIRAAGPLMKAASSFGGTSTIAMRRQIRAAAADSAISGILLLIDSPGGSVAGTQDLASEVKMATRKKPVWAFVDDLGASAAYWIASQANMIFANGTTALVGSIGAVMTVYDLSAAAEKEGVKAMVFATGPLKGAGTPGSKITDEQAAYFQGLIDAAQTNFDAAVKSGRGMSQTMLNDVRTGAVFPANVALAKGLIDGIRTLESTIDALGAAK